MHPIHLPFTKLPPTIDEVLFLIAEELKIQKFFDGLFAVGIEGCFYEPRLGKLILHYLGMDDGRDETYELYQRIIDSHLPNVEADYDVLTTQALHVYNALLAEASHRQRNTSGQN